MICNKIAFGSEFNHGIRTLLNGIYQEYTVYMGIYAFDFGTWRSQKYERKNAKFLILKKMNENENENDPLKMNVFRPCQYSYIAYSRNFIKL